MMSVDLKLDNGHKTVVLADRSITGEGVSGLANSLQAWEAILITAFYKNSSPLCEAATFSIEGGGSAV